MHIDFRSYVLILQFLLRNGIELPRKLSCKSNGGSALKSSKHIEIRAHGHYKITIFSRYSWLINTRRLRIKILWPVCRMKAHRVPWDIDTIVGNDADETERAQAAAKNWEYRYLFGFILFNEVKK